jgi:hypothetical protein
VIPLPDQRPAIGPDGAAQERIGTLLKIDVLLAHAPTQPVMLIQTDTGRKRKMRTHADEHTAPVFVVDVEVVLHDPALRELQMPAILLLFPMAIMMRAGSRPFTIATT